MQVVYERLFQGRWMVCFKITNSISAWVETNATSTHVILGANVERSEYGMLHALNKSGIALLQGDINEIRKVMMDTTVYQKATQAKASSSRVIILQLQRADGNIEFAVEYALCLGVIIVFKQGRGRICKLKFKDFQELFYYLGIYYNDGRTMIEPMDVDEETSNAASCFSWC